MFNKRILCYVDLFVAELNMENLCLQAAPKRQLRFNIPMDIALFKETLSVNPFDVEGMEAQEAWSKVGENTALAMDLNSVITGRTSKERIEQQLRYYRENNRKNLKKQVHIIFFCVCF